MKNNQRVAYYSTTFGERFQNPGEYLYTWPCHINRIDIKTDGTEENSHISPNYMGEMPFPPCSKPDMWQE